jgi:hypothetical protein
MLAMVLESHNLMPVARYELRQHSVVQGVQINIEEGRDRRDEDDFSFAKLDSRDQQIK